MVWHQNTNGPKSSEWTIFHRKCLWGASVGTRHSSSLVTTKHPLFLLYTIFVEGSTLLCIYLFSLYKRMHTTFCSFYALSVFFSFLDLSFFLQRYSTSLVLPFFYIYTFTTHGMRLLLTMLTTVMPVLEPHTRLTNRGSQCLWLNCTSTVAKTYLLV